MLGVGTGALFFVVAVGYDAPEFEEVGHQDPMIGGMLLTHFAPPRALELAANRPYLAPLGNTVKCWMLS